MACVHNHRSYLCPQLSVVIILHMALAFQEGARLSTRQGSRWADELRLVLRNLTHRETQDLEAKNGFPESLLPIKEALQAADGMLVASPE